MPCSVASLLRTAKSLKWGQAMPPSSSALHQERSAAQGNRHLSWFWKLCEEVWLCHGPFRSARTTHRPLIFHHPRLQRPMPSNTGMTIGGRQRRGIVSMIASLIVCEQMHAPAEGGTDGLGCVGDVTENVIRRFIVGHLTTPFTPFVHVHGNNSTLAHRRLPNTSSKQSTDPSCQKTTRCSFIPSPPASHYTHDALTLQSRRIGRSCHGGYETPKAPACTATIRGLIAGLEKAWNGTRLRTPQL